MSLKETRPIPFRAHGGEALRGARLKNPNCGGESERIQSWETIGTEEEFLLFEKRSDPPPRRCVTVPRKE